MSWNSLFRTFSFPGIVIYYNYLVPEGERHDSAVKRNREALSTEVKLWEEYLKKVKLKAGKSSMFKPTGEKNGVICDT